MKKNPKGENNLTHIFFENDNVNLTHILDPEEKYFWMIILTSDKDSFPQITCNSEHWDDSSDKAFINSSFSKVNYKHPSWKKIIQFF